jgi:hypothetical protein
MPVLRPQNKHRLILEVVLYTPLQRQEISQMRPLQNEALYEAARRA